MSELPIMDTEELRDHLSGFDPFRRPLWRNRKTGKPYFVISEGKDCTNIRDGLDVIVYWTGSGGVFVRERAEFFEKLEMLTAEKKSLSPLEVMRQRLIALERECSSLEGVGSEHVAKAIRAILKDTP